MTSPSAPPMLEELVNAYEGRGPLALGELRQHPVLVHSDKSAKGESWGFETKAMIAPWDTRVALALARSGRVADPELLSKAGACYPVMKRPGGPFPDRIGVGRTRTADISLRLAGVSKYHAYFTHDDAQHTWTLWDARSRNGTTVGDKRLAAGEGKVIENGVYVLFGEDGFLFFTATGFKQLVESLAQSTPGAMR